MLQHFVPAWGCVLFWARLTEFPGSLVDAEQENFTLLRLVGLLLDLACDLVRGLAFEVFGISKSR